MGASVKQHTLPAAGARQKIRSSPIGSRQYTLLDGGERQQINTPRPRHPAGPRPKFEHVLPIASCSVGGGEAIQTYGPPLPTGRVGIIRSSCCGGCCLDLRLPSGRPSGLIGGGCRLVHHRLLDDDEEAASIVIVGAPSSPGWRMRRRGRKGAAVTFRTRRLRSNG